MVAYGKLTRVPVTVNCATAIPDTDAKHSSDCFIFFLGGGSFLDIYSQLSINIESRLKLM